MTGLEQPLPQPPDVPSSTLAEERALLAGLLKKDRKATAEFISRYSDSVYAFVRSRLAPRFDLVDDLVQEVFLAAWESMHQFQGAGPLQGWLLGIARHKVEDQYRALLRAPQATPEVELESLAGAMMPDFDGVLDQAQLQAKTWRVMDSLQEQYRLALIWRYWDKASAREMAARLGKTEKAVERLLARARQQFRERWGDA
ncbi:MAG: sigma-70 family RNA polymerase sigma factor [Candidatus Sulfotelmatobacter sp.]